MFKPVPVEASQVEEAARSQSVPTAAAAAAAVDSDSIYTAQLQRRFVCSPTCLGEMTDEEINLFFSLTGAQLIELKGNAFRAGFPIGDRFHTIAVFKPVDCVRGLDGGLPAKRGIPPVIELSNEILAVKLAKLPQMVISARINGRTGMAMPFFEDAVSLSSLSIVERTAAVAQVSLKDWQKVMMMDLRFHNTDRNFSNLMVEDSEVYPIDQGLIWPAEFASPATLCWMHFPQAQQPFEPEIVQEIQSLDFERDRAVIQKEFPDYPVKNLEAMRITYSVLKKATAAGFSPVETAAAFFLDLIQSQESNLRRLYASARQQSNDPEQVFRIMELYTDNWITYVKAIREGRLIPVTAVPTQSAEQPQHPK